MTAPKPTPLPNESLDSLIAALEKRIEYNAHDMGEMGNFIRVKYAKNFLVDFKKSIQALINNEVVKARLDELNTLGYETAKNDWHKDRASLMWQYVAERIEELKNPPITNQEIKDNEQEGEKK